MKQFDVGSKELFRVDKRQQHENEVNPPITSENNGGPTKNKKTFGLKSDVSPSDRERVSVYISIALGIPERIPKKTNRVSEHHVNRPNTSRQKQLRVH